MDFEQRQAFEASFSDNNQWPRAIERNGEGYVLMQTQAAWVTWQKAWEAALNRAIELIPGGSVVDPQWVCDTLRELGGTRST